MAYFISTPDCQNYRQEWESVVQQIQNWPVGWQARFTLPLHHLEVKGLHVFTMARRFIGAAVKLARAEGGRWQLAFL